MVIYKSFENHDLISGVRRGDIGVAPTDTIYGLVASALNKQAVEKVYDIKGRSINKPFIILIADIDDLSKFNIKISKSKINELSDYWPGANSLILTCKDAKFEYLTRGTASLAFRLPDNDELRNFLKKTGPLVAPSANYEGGKPASNISEAIKYFNEKVDFYVDGGELNNPPSNLIDMTSNQPIKLR